MDMELRPQFDELLSKFGAQGQVKPPSREGLQAVESFELGFLRDPVTSLDAMQEAKEGSIQRRQAAKQRAHAEGIPVHAAIAVAERMAAAQEAQAQLPQVPDEADDLPEAPAGSRGGELVSAAGAALLGLGKG